MTVLKNSISSPNNRQDAGISATELSSAQAKIMGKTKLDAFEVGCPCCGALLKVDPEARAVIAHTPPVRPKTFNDFEEAARAMREQEGRK